jgi:16S rRNA C967 or C1407 C5-methylase (RsmB/RsmF family)/NOL1/NOP2/fmu family ribosome biogenesis protein
VVKEIPLAFQQQMKGLLGNDYNLFVEVIGGESPVSLRFNPRKPAKENLFQDEIDGSVVWHPEAVYLKSRPVFTLDPAFHAGAYYVQEASSMFVGEALKQHVDFSKPLKVLDLCAAPGGKTTLVADLLNEDSLLVANEVIKTRVGVLKENLLKWGFANHIVVNHDPEEFADLEGFFDVVLVDAPCSGEGLFRKDKDASLHWSEEAVNTCSARQRRILQAAAMCVAPDGILLYSTCTYNTSENRENVNWFVKNHDFEVQELAIDNFGGIVETKPGYQFYPHKIKGEGFFLAVLKNKGGNEDFINSRIKLNRLPVKQVEELGKWLRTPEKFDFYLKKEGDVIAVPQDLTAEYGTVLKALFKRSSGFEIGVFKGKDFIPSHALALSVEWNEKLPQLSVSKENALLYLKRESFDVSAKENGWHLVMYQSLALGWAKVLGDRINNYLPKEWRIRMDLE